MKPNPFQPRADFEPTALEELRASIQQHGVIQPICVRRVGDDYELISGERRTRAAKLAGLTTIPAVIRDAVSDPEMLELALVENIQRADLNPLEKASAYRDLVRRIGLTQEEVAAKVGVNRATVANHLRLLELPERVQQALREGLVTMGHARALLALKSERGMEELLGRIVRDGLSVREVEDRVRAGITPVPPPAPRAEVPVTKPAPWVNECEERLRVALGTKVRLYNRAGYRGQIVIEYYSREELERLLDALAPKPTL